MRRSFGAKDSGDLKVKYLFSTLALMALISAPARADDNVANCEVVVLASIDPDAKEGAKEDAKEEATQIANFIPAGDFIFSVFGDMPHMTEIDGKPIRAVMCTRASVVPSEFDLEMIRTGIPFYLSPNFDSKDSAFLGVSKTEENYTYSYAGPDLSEDDTNLLKLRMKALNNAED